jgi:hypothetical protein
VRFQNDVIYTYTGPILLALNPFQRLPLYTRQVRRRFPREGRSHNRTVVVPALARVCAGCTTCACGRACVGCIGQCVRAQTVLRLLWYARRVGDLCFSRHCRSLTLCVCVCRCVSVYVGVCRC